MLKKYEEKINHDAYQAFEESKKKLKKLTRGSEYFCIPLSSIRTIEGKKIPRGYSLAQVSDVQLPVKYCKKGYFKEQITGMELKILVPITLDSKDDEKTFSVRLDGEELYLSFKTVDDVSLRNTLAFSKGLKNGLCMRPQTKDLIESVSRQEAHLNFCDSFEDDEKRNQFIESFEEVAKNTAKKNQNCAKENC